MIAKLLQQFRCHEFSSGRSASASVGKAPPMFEEKRDVLHKGCNQKTPSGSSLLGHAIIRGLPRLSREEPASATSRGEHQRSLSYRSTKNFKSSGIKGGLGFKSLLITSAKL